MVRDEVLHVRHNREVVAAAEQHGRTAPSFPSTLPLYVLQPSSIRSSDPLLDCWSKSRFFVLYYLFSLF